MFWNFQTDLSYIETATLEGSMKIYYNPKLKQLARNLRNNSTLSEVLFWNEVKGKKILGLQFLRQKPIGEFIVDFYCPKLKLAIEIDGESHGFKDAIQQDEKKRNIFIEFRNFSHTIQ